MDKEKFVRNCIIAVDHITEQLEKDNHKGANQLISAIGIIAFMGVDYQIQLVLNSDKKAWIGTNEIGFAHSKTTGYVGRGGHFDD
jgi:hypothetical protein